MFLLSETFLLAIAGSEVGQHSVVSRVGVVLGLLEIDFHLLVSLINVSLKLSMDAY